MGESFKGRLGWLGKAYLKKDIEAKTWRIDEKSQVDQEGEEEARGGEGTQGFWGGLTVLRAIKMFSTEEWHI